MNAVLSLPWRERVHARRLQVLARISYAISARNSEVENVSNERQQRIGVQIQGGTGKTGTIYVEGPADIGVSIGGAPKHLTQAEYELGDVSVKFASDTGVRDLGDMSTDAATLKLAIENLISQIESHSGAYAELERHLAELKAANVLMSSPKARLDLMTNLIAPAMRSAGQSLGSESAKAASHAVFSALMKFFGAP